MQFTPGTSTDILARLIAQKMGEDWGQQVIVDNRPGAGGVVGTELGAKATPDGYTLTMAVSSAFGINPTLYSKLPYDAIRDFAPIANLGLTPQTLVANPSATFKTVKEFVAAANDKPGQINYASLGSGSTSHLTMEMFRSTAGIKLNHVPFKGSADAHTQLIGGQIPVMFDAIPATLPHIKSGRLRGLGIATLKRSPFLPDLPTIAESGYPGFEAVGWIGIAAPAKTPTVDARQTERGDGEDPQPAGRQGAPQYARVHAGRRHARAVRGLHQVRDREVGQGGQGIRAPRPTEVPARYQSHLQRDEGPTRRADSSHALATRKDC